MSPFGKRKAVLAVNVPGMAPYAVLDSKFKAPHGKVDIAGAGLPALVSITDPTDIEILWDEVPSLGSQVAQRVSEAMQNAGANPAAPGGPMAGLPAEMMTENAKRALAFVKDPAMREMLIKQYRAAGIQIDDPE